jgi:hypothetical protein
MKSSESSALRAILERPEENPLLPLVDLLLLELGDDNSTSDPDRQSLLSSINSLSNNALLLIDVLRHSRLLSSELGFEENGEAEEVMMRMSSKLIEAERTIIDRARQEKKSSKSDDETRVFSLKREKALKESCYLCAEILVLLIENPKDKEKIKELKERVRIDLDKHRLGINKSVEDVPGAQRAMRVTRRILKGSLEVGEGDTAIKLVEAVQSEGDFGATANTALEGWLDEDEAVEPTGTPKTPAAPPIPTVEEEQSGSHEETAGPSESSKIRIEADTIVAKILPSPPKREPILTGAENGPEKKGSYSIKSLAFVLLLSLVLLPQSSLESFPLKKELPVKGKVSSSIDAKVKPNALRQKLLAIILHGKTQEEVSQAIDQCRALIGKHPNAEQYLKEWEGMAHNAELIKSITSRADLSGMNDESLKALLARLKVHGYSLPQIDEAIKSCDEHSELAQGASFKRAWMNLRTKWFQKRNDLISQMR